MRYSLIFELAATEIIVALPEIPHELFTLGCFDIADNPTDRAVFLRKLLIR